MKKLPFRKGDRVRFHITDGVAGTITHVASGGSINVLWDDGPPILNYLADDLVHLPKKCKK